MQNSECPSLELFFNKLFKMTKNQFLVFELTYPLIKEFLCWNHFVDDKNYIPCSMCLSSITLLGFKFENCFNINSLKTNFCQTFQNINFRTRVLSILWVWNLNQLRKMHLKLFATLFEENFSFTFCKLGFLWRATSIMHNQA